MRAHVSKGVVVLLLASAWGCDSTADELPGAYVGSLDTSTQGSRMQNLRPDGQGSFRADVTHYSNSTSRSGARVEVRRLEDASGYPNYEATLPDLCTIRFQLLDGGNLSHNMQPLRCPCPVGDRSVEGLASVAGSFTDGRLDLTVSVSLPNPEYTGGCTHAFRSQATP